MRYLCIRLKVETNACFDATYARTTGQGGRHGDEVAGRKKKPGNEARATPSLGYTVFKVVVPLA